MLDRVRARRPPTSCGSAKAATATYLVRFNRDRPGDQNELVDQLREAFAAKIGELEVERVEFVGPKVGEELRRDGFVSLAVASVLLSIYIGFRFTPIFAPGRDRRPGARRGRDVRRSW